MTRKYNRGISEAQSNALALERRSTPYTDAHRGSMTFQWDWQKREPTTLRDAVRFVRKAYEDEVPRRMTEGPDSIGDDGTPRFSSQAEGYIFGSPTRTDAGQDNPLVSYYTTPFRATLDQMERHHSEATRKRAAIVRHVTIGSMTPEAAAAKEGVPVWCTRDVTQAALTVFIRQLSDMRVDVAKQEAAA